MSNFKVGDVVRLKSNQAVDMTVEASVEHPEQGTTIT